MTPPENARTYKVRAFLMYWARSDERGPAMDGELDGKAAQGVAGEGGAQASRRSRRDTKTPRRTARKR